ncbi:MAG: hypothetical protein IJJ09_06090 [Synergistaceae bacterium]|nr:hypothetical protein [Synergistaceae bacterium]
MLASFIGGSEVEIIPLRIWNQNGDLIISEKGKILRELEDGAKIIALDENEASETGITTPNKFNIKY